MMLHPASEARRFTASPRGTPSRCSVTSGSSDQSPSSRTSALAILGAATAAATTTAHPARTHALTLDITRLLGANDSSGGLLRGAWGVPPHRDRGPDHDHAT